MSSDGEYSSERCYRIVFTLDTLQDEFIQKLPTNISTDDLNQLFFSCEAEYDKERSEELSKPMVWIGIYIAVASLICILAMAADLLRGFRNKKFWFPCKYFFLNAASIAVITIAMKLPVDLSGDMPTYGDQATKVGSLGFMCTMMANLMPSLASMDNKTLLANLTGLCILVITMIVNICIQINTGAIDKALVYVAIDKALVYVACFYMAMMILLLIMMISSSLTIPTSKEILERKYQAANKVLLVDGCLEHIQLSEVVKLRRYVRRYWVMAETSSPQFVMSSKPLSTASGVICVLVMALNLLMAYVLLLKPEQFKTVFSDLKNKGGSSYKWSTPIILLTQSIGVVVGTIAPISRCFTVFNFKLGTKWNRKYFMVFKVEKYWTQKLHEWKQSPVLFLSCSPRAKNLIYNLKSIFLGLCIIFQKVNVILCKVIHLVASIFFVIGLYCWKSLKSLWLTPPNTLRTEDIDEDLRKYIMQIDNEMELSEKIMKRISNSLTSFISKAENEQNNNLLELVKKSTGFKGVQIFFESDHVQPLLPFEFVNSWSLPIITLTCIAIALPNIHVDEVESFLRCVSEGISFTQLVDESLYSASGYVNHLRTIRILWQEVEHKRKWLDKSLVNNVFKSKTSMEIVKWFSDKAKKKVIEIKEGTHDGELMENPPPTLIVANSMYQITQTILFRYQSNIEPINQNQLFTHLKSIVADIFSACFTNIPQVIRLRCHDCMIEKRETSVKVAAKLLGKSMKIIERLETLEIPSMDDDKMAYIDEWRLYLKQSIS